MKENSTLLLIEVSSEYGGTYVDESEIDDVIRVISCIRGVGDVSRVGIDITAEVERRLSAAGLFDLLPGEPPVMSRYDEGTPRQFILSLQALSLVGLLCSDLNLSDPLSEDNRGAVSEVFCRCREWYVAAKSKQRKRAEEGVGNGKH